MKLRIILCSLLLLLNVFFNMPCVSWMPNYFMQAMNQGHHNPLWGRCGKRTLEMQMCSCPQVEWSMWVRFPPCCHQTPAQTNAWFPHRVHEHMVWNMVSKTPSTKCWKDQFWNVILASKGESMLTESTHSQLELYMTWFQATRSEIKCLGRPVPTAIRLFAMAGLELLTY